MSKQIWLHSDWHWKHENIYKFTMEDGQRVRREFKDTAEGDAFIEQRWRDLVKPRDHVWCLGDLAMFRGQNMAHAFIEFFHKLPGHKRLILGNHDHYNVGIYLKAGFDKVRGSNMIDGVLMTHYPVHLDSHGFRALGNAHGHIHRNPSPAGPYFNCCVEANNYEPIPIEVVAKRLKELRDVGVGGTDQGAS